MPSTSIALFSFKFSMVKFTNSKSTMGFGKTLIWLLHKYASSVIGDFQYFNFLKMVVFYGANVTSKYDF